MNQKTKVNLAILGAVVAVSFSAPMIKLALGAGAPAVIIAFYRLLFSTLLLAPGVIARKSIGKELASLNGKDKAYLLLSGLFLALHFTCWINSLNLTSTFASTVIVCLQPLFTLIGGFLLFRERPEKNSYVGILICVIGAAVIALGSASQGGNSFGDFLALLGAMFASAYFLCNKHLRQKLSLSTHTFCVYGICSLFLLVLVLVTGMPLFGYSPTAFLLFAGLAIVCTLMGHSVLNWALKYAKAAFVSVALLGEPIGASIWAFLIFKEIPTLPVLAGGLVIILGIVWFTLSENKA